MTEVQPTPSGPQDRGPSARTQLGHNIWGEAAEEGPNEDAALPGSLLGAVPLLTEAPLARAAERASTRGREGRGQSPELDQTHSGECPSWRTPAVQRDRAREKEQSKRQASFVREKQ